MDTHETDYLVIGAGAMGMAFADALFDLCDARITLVDRHHRPGGHWNDAYPFVRLHQPSAFYGLNSQPLADPVIDTEGTNAGLYGMASGQQVLDHFDEVLRHKLLPSGRVRFLSMTEHVGADARGHQRVRALLDGLEMRVAVRRKLVHATLTATEVPSTRAPRYRVAAGVRCVPPNALPGITRPYPRTTVVGAGKTGMDACLWLLQHGTAPERIRRIVPQDAWFLDRANVQPGVENLRRFFESLAVQLECVAQAAALDQLFVRLEATGQLLRLDPTVRPTAYRCATVTRQELAQLRRIGSVLRLGRVRDIAPHRMLLERGQADVLANELFVDCSARGLRSQRGIPVFEGDAAIHLQMVRQCAPPFSGAFAAAVECLVEGDAAVRNALCHPIPLPQHDVDWVTMLCATLRNRQQWAQHVPLMQWLAASRLDYGTRMRRQVPPDVMERYAQAMRAAAPRWPALLAACEQRRVRLAATPAAAPSPRTRELAAPLRTA